ncbi:hypothetical protein P8815_18120 [Bacillus altitudinis]|uniref:hypothetical protein n=1 Tax=Bacillus TaxID=1386 RepID=UPI000260A9BE|nr:MULTISPECIES: hypothetical protein [Bacillus]EIL83371.1 hypothetical protein BAME_34350 [Bacillus sp. M 2-6]MEC0473657.1 hypothetical protein [Bacillus altitudinis]
MDIIHEKTQLAMNLYDHALDANTRKLLQVYLQEQPEDQQKYNEFVSKLEAIFNFMFREFKRDNFYNSNYKNEFILNDISNDIFRFIHKDNMRQENVAFSFEEGSDQPLVGYFNDRETFIPATSIKEALFKSSSPMNKALTRINSIINILAKGLTYALAVYYLFYLLTVGSLNLYNEHLNEVFNLEIDMISTSPVDALSKLFHFCRALLEEY